MLEDLHCCNGVSAMPGLSSLGTMTSETGLGILAKFASSALSASFQATKAKSEETYLWGSSSLSSSIHKRRTEPGEDSCLWGGSSLAPSLSKRRGNLHFNPSQFCCRCYFVFSPLSPRHYNIKKKYVKKKFIAALLFHAFGF